MNKYIRLSLFALGFSLSSQSFADVDGKFYIAAAGLSGSGEDEFTINFTSGGSLTGTNEYDASETQLMLGYRFKSNNRMELSFTSLEFEYENGFTRDISGVDLDWTFTANEKTFSPYLLLGLGVYARNDPTEPEPDNTDRTGAALNVGLGLIMSLGDHFELDLGYKVRAIGWEEIEGISYTEERTSLTQQARLGARILF